MRRTRSRVEGRGMMLSCRFDRKQINSLVGQSHIGFPLTPPITHARTRPTSLRRPCGPIKQARLSSPRPDKVTQVRSAYNTCIRTSHDHAVVMIIVLYAMCQSDREQPPPPPRRRRARSTRRRRPSPHRRRPLLQPQQPPDPPCELSDPSSSCLASCPGPA